MITDCAAYRAGRRVEGTLDLDRAAAVCVEDDTFVWVGLHDPSADEVAAVRAEFGLDPEAFAEAIRYRNRPEVAVDGEVLYAVFKTALYVPEDERVELGRIVVVAGPTFVITLRYGASSELASTRKDLEAKPELLCNGPCTVVYAAVDRIIDDYIPVLGGLDDSLREVEQAVFSPEVAEHAERIYRLKREVLEFQRASAPLTSLMMHLAAGRFPMVPQSVRTYYGGVEDRLVRVAEDVERVSSLLSSMLDANSAQVAMQQARLALEQTHIATRQNADMRKISAWVAIIAVPTMVAGIYGMNFDAIPGLHSPFGFPVVMVVMVALCVVLYRVFRRSGWL
ncbi:magnesium and cobalt transport protein CorA [Pseudonocardia sp. TRM90224]|uniref:magnesium and cobalt transport protein CorA n=1 Tax=Pseudonocardia sp. TRM90224 TaxID=2812678 RepID=UPI001E5B7AFA|nr:magnesium and cobalt transport protein CorA [Pseudonocardia sp. TRM90224]